MPSTTTGHAATVQSVLPTVKNISSTTHATPIVVTTSAAHGLNTGDYLTIEGATDPAANGDWRAGTVTSTTVALTTTPAGTNSVGTLVGGAVGTLQGRQFGAAITIPSGGDRPSAASVNTPVEALADQAAWLLYSKLNRLGDTATGLITFAGDTNFTANTTNTLKANAVLATDSGSTIIASGTVELLGRKTTRPRIALSDADHTINTTQADEWTLPSPTGTRIITLQTTTAPVPIADEVISLVVPAMATSTFVYSIRREDGTVICQFAGVSGVTTCITAQFRFSGGVWRLGPNSGTAFTWNAGLAVNVACGVLWSTGA